MNTGPRFARRTDSNHKELRDCILDCAKAYPEMRIAWLDTSNLGGKMGDGIIQYFSISPGRRDYPTNLIFHFSRFNTHLLEFKSSKKKKFTKS